MQGAENSISLIDGSHAIGGEAALPVTLGGVTIRMVPAGKLPVRGFDLIAGAAGSHSKEQAGAFESHRAGVIIRRIVWRGESPGQRN